MSDKITVEMTFRVAANAATQALDAVSLDLRRRKVLSALSADLAPLRERFTALAEALDTDNAALRSAALDAFRAELPELFERIHAGGRTASSLVSLLSHGASRGIAESARERKLSVASNAVSYTSEPSADALGYVKRKTVLRTTGRTAELDKLPAALRERAAFSAGVTQAEFLDDAYAVVRSLVEGTSDRATLRLGLKRQLAGMGYQPEKGTESGLKDLSSDARLNVILDTNYAQARGYAWNEAGQDEDLLDAFPAQEFLRVEERDQPRDWVTRWNEARAKVGPAGTTDARSGRMVALKNHPIWRELNRFGNDYEPFDFNSGMGTEDVDRSDAMALGIIGRDDQVTPQHHPLNEDLQSSPEIRDAALRDALEATGLGAFDSSDVFHFREESA